MLKSKLNPNFSRNLSLILTLILLFGGIKSSFANESIDLFVLNFSYDDSNGNFSIFISNNGNKNSMMVPFEIIGTDKENINISRYEFIIEQIKANSSIRYSERIGKNLSQLIIKIDSENLNEETCEENNLFYYPENISTECENNQEGINNTSKTNLLNKQESYGSGNSGNSGGSSSTTYQEKEIIKNEIIKDNSLNIKTNKNDENDYNLMNNTINNSSIIKNNKNISNYSKVESKGNISNIQKNKKKYINKTSVSENISKNTEKIHESESTFKKIYLFIGGVIASIIGILALS